MASRGRRYAVQAQNAVASPTKTSVTLTSTTAIRPFIYDMLLGSSATPADNALVWRVQRFTAAGTTTAFTPLALDPADPAATLVAGVTATVEPTYTGSTYLFSIALNQRATHRWIADPDGPITLPATANNGAGLFVVHASFTGNVDPTVHYAE